MSRFTVKLYNVSSRASGTAMAATSKPSSSLPPIGIVMPNISTGTVGYKFDNARYGKNIVLVEGVRTPFLISGTDYKDLLGYELQKEAIQ